jgi:hypothetical protein
MRNYCAFSFSSSLFTDAADEMELIFVRFFFFHLVVVLVEMLLLGNEFCCAVKFESQERADGLMNYV